MNNSVAIDMENLDMDAESTGDEEQEVAEALPTEFDYDESRAEKHFKVNTSSYAFTLLRAASSQMGCLMHDLGQLDKVSAA